MLRLTGKGLQMLLHLQSRVNHLFLRWKPAMIVGPAGLPGGLGLTRQIAMIQHAVNRQQQRQGQRGIPRRTPARLIRPPTADGELPCSRLSFCAAG